MIEEENLENFFSEEQEEKKNEEEIEIEIPEKIEKDKKDIPSFWSKKYTYEDLNQMDSFELSDLLDEKSTTVNTKALIIQVLASRGIYID